MGAYVGRRWQPADRLDIRISSFVAVVIHPTTGMSIADTPSLKPSGCAVNGVSAQSRPGTIFRKCFSPCCFHPASDVCSHPWPSHPGLGEMFNTMLWGGAEL
jgi:hypothetical protein